MKNRSDEKGLGGESMPSHINRMENILDNAVQKLDALDKMIEEYEAYQTEIQKLEDYYSSPQWKADFAADEEGRYPDTLKRGVLSEDGIWNMLERNREMLARIGAQEPDSGKQDNKVRKILVVIDMQNDFIDAALGTKEAAAIVDAVKEKIRSYPVTDVIATMDTHGENYMQTQEGKYLPVPHCIKGSEGWQIRSDIAELLSGAKIYEKPTFGSTSLAMDLKAISEAETIELELIGLCTDICVVSNALLLKAAMPEVKISVDASCCAGVTPEKHLAALETMRSCQIQIVNG